MDDLSFASLHRSKLSSLPTSFSDSCLAKRGLEDSDEFKISSSSAPQSRSGSSENDDEDEDSGETDDMEQYDPSVNNASQGIRVEEKVANGVLENKTEFLSEGETKNDKPENKNVELCPTEGGIPLEGGPDEGEASKECGFVVGDESGGEEQSDEDDRGASLGDEEVVARETSPGDFDQNKPERDEHNESKEKEQVETNRVKDQGNQEEQTEITSDQLTGSKSQEKLSDEHRDSNELATTEDETTPPSKQRNGEIASKEHDVNVRKNNEGYQISFHGATASIKVSHSNVELGTMATSGGVNSGERSPERRRFGARFPGNRGLKLFATAQARGRTLIPELRSKLSSFSQQVRSRSPKLVPKRPSLHSESNHEQKQLKRKCRTKIIEL